MTSEATTATSPPDCYCAAVIVSALLLNACGSDITQIDLPDAKAVHTVVLGKPELSAVRRFPGRVQAYQTAQLAFQVSGPLVDLPVTEGQKVAKGDLLASIDPRHYENELNARQSDAVEARKQFERYAQLLKTKSVPEDQYQLQKARYEMAAARRYEMAAARLKQAEKNLDDTNLRAPFSGIVARRYVENFQKIKAAESIILLEDVSRFDVVVQVAEQGLASLDPEQLRTGVEVGEVTFENLPERHFPASVKEVRIAANPETQPYKVTLTLPAPDEVRNLPGMSATVVPTVEYAKWVRTTFIVPVTAVLAGPDGTPFVRLWDRGAMTVTRRAVSVGELTGEEFRRIKSRHGARACKGLNPENCRACDQEKSGQPVRDVPGVGRWSHLLRAVGASGGSRLYHQGCQDHHLLPRRHAQRGGTGGHRYHRDRAPAHAAAQVDQGIAVDEGAVNYHAANEGRILG